MRNTDCDHRATAVPPAEGIGFCGKNGMQLNWLCNDTLAQPQLSLVRPMKAVRVIALIIFLAASTQAQPLDVAPSAAQLREWIDNGCVDSGKHVGIDYSNALERAIRREPAGLAELFRYTVIGDLDGEAGEAHATILFGLLQRWGDRRFADVLSAQKLRVRKAVMDNIAMPPGSRHKFPLTYASVPLGSRQ